MSLLARTEISHRWRQRLYTALAAVLSIGALVTGPAASRASAATRPQFTPTEVGVFNAIFDYQTGLCLDSNGSAYTLACNGGNYQTWDVYTDPYGGYNFVDNQTGECLDSNDAGDVYTSPCNWNNTYQNWTTGGNGPANTVQDGQTGRCLDSNYAGNIYTSPCNWNDTYQNWTFF
jgi:hypothetical protein